MPGPSPSSSKARAQVGEDVGARMQQPQPSPPQRLESQTPPRTSQVALAAKQSPPREAQRSTCASVAAAQLGSSEIRPRVKKDLVSSEAADLAAPGQG